MDTRLKKALELANALETITNQKEQALARYNQNKILFYNGGTFIADYNLLTTIGFLKNNLDIDQIVVDVNNIPILISNIEEFYFLIQSRIVESSRQYYTEYESIKRSRTPKSVLEK